MRLFLVLESHLLSVPESFFFSVLFTGTEDSHHNVVDYNNVQVESNFMVIFRYTFLCVTPD